MNAPAKTPHVMKVIKVGNSAGIVLPKEVLRKLGDLGIGDLIDVVDGPDGIVFKRHDAGFAEQMAVARDVMKRRRDALRELAK